MEASSFSQEDSCDDDFHDVDDDDDYEDGDAADDDDAADADEHDDHEDDDDGYCLQRKLLSFHINSFSYYLPFCIHNYRSTVHMRKVDSRHATCFSPPHTYPYI